MPCSLHFQWVLQGLTDVGWTFLSVSLSLSLQGLRQEPYLCVAKLRTECAKVIQQRRASLGRQGRRYEELSYNSRGVHFKRRRVWSSVLFRIVLDRPLWSTSAPPSVGWQSLSMAGAVSSPSSSSANSRASALLPIAMCGFRVFSGHVASVALPPLVTFLNEHEPPQLPQSIRYQKKPAASWLRPRCLRAHPNNQFF